MASRSEATGTHPQAASANTRLTAHATPTRQPQRGCAGGGGGGNGCPGSGGGGPPGAIGCDGIGGTPATGGDTGSVIPGGR